MSGCTQVCNQGRDCTCAGPKDDCAASVARIKASPRQPEVGNIWFADPEPIEPLRGWEMLLVWGLLLVLGLFSTALIFTGAGYLWQRWLA